MTDQYQIADKTYMYGERYEPDKIDILRTVIYDFDADTLYNIQPILIPSLWRIISDYAESIKKIVFELWKHKNRNYIYYNWFGEYTFGTVYPDWTYGENSKIWLTNKSGATFHNIADPIFGGFKINYHELIAPQLKNWSVIDYDSKKQPFAYPLSSIEHGIGSGIHNDSFSKSLRRKFAGKFPTNFDIFVYDYSKVDDSEERDGVNLAFLIETDNIIRECKWINNIQGSLRCYVQN